jgi:nucleoside-diphosphate-sugar epimerase
MEQNTEPLETDGSRNDTKPIVIVTGSSGLIGTHIIKRLATAYRIVGLDKEGGLYPPPEAECVNFDITDPASIKAAFERIRYGYGNRIASVVHLAAYYDFSGKPSPLYEEVTVKGTEKLINELHNFQVDQFIFSSTNLIYKPTEPGKKINEDAPLAPNWDYPESKVDTEELIKAKRGLIPIVILRLAGVYDEWTHSIPIAHHIQRIYEKQFTSHFYSGDVTHGNVFLHMDDLLDAIEKTVGKRELLLEDIAVNIGEPITPSYQQLQNTIGLLIHSEKWETYEVPAPLAKAGAWTMDLFGDPFIKPWMIDRADDHYELDISRAKKILDWEPKHNLIDTLPEMIRNLGANPEKWYEENKLEKGQS